MIIDPSEQGSPKWLMARNGIPTASQFKNIVTATGKHASSAVRKTYMAQLLAERLTETPPDNFVTDAMLRGIELEPRARSWYEVETGYTVDLVGLCFRDEKRQFGASPDGLVKANDSVEYFRGLECKALLNKAHFHALMDGKIPNDYVPQVQACMWICDLPTWDFVLFDPSPKVPSAIWTIEKDEDVHAAYEEYIPAFCKELDEREAELRKLLPEPEPEREAEDAFAFLEDDNGLQ